MKSKDILKHTRHRTYPYPSRPWSFYQEWNQAIFMHWEVPIEKLQPLIPNPFKLDSLNGKTWISLVAFNMNHIGIRSVLKIPHISDFHEINIRTYITYKDKPAVYFLNMEGSKKSSCRVLKSLSKFPYQYSKMSRNAFSFQSKNKINDAFYAEFRLPGNQISKDEIDIWLTERYAVFFKHKNKILEYDVHHKEWPLEAIDIKNIKINYPKFNHLLNNSPDKVHYSKGVQVLTWNKRKFVENE